MVLEHDLGGVLCTCVTSAGLCAVLSYASARLGELQCISTGLYAGNLDEGFFA